MATSPAGWRDRAQGVQLAGQRAAFATGKAIRALIAQGRAGFAAAWAALARWRVERARLSAWGRILSSDLEAIVGSDLADASRRGARRVGPAVRWGWRGVTVVAGASGRGARRLGSDLGMLVRAAGAALPRRAAGDAARVQTESGDDLATVLGRIDAASSPDVVLVVPRGVAALRTPAAWVHIGAHARRRGLNLAVVAARYEVRDYAEQTGFVAARTWGGLPGARPRLLPGIGTTVWRPALTMLVGLTVLVQGIGYALPTATIEIAPPSEPIEAEVQLRVNPLAPGIDARGRTVPGVTAQRTVRAAVSVPATGSARVGDRPAAVRLVFRNEGAAARDLAVGTVVRDAGRVGFSTTGALRVEPGASAEIEAIALRPGTVGNVAPQTLTVVEDALAGLAVTNPAPAHGGSDRVTTGVSQADVDRAGRLAGGVLAKVAVRELAAEHEGGLVVGESLTIAIVGSQPLQQLDEAAESFVAEYVARAAAVVVPPDMMRSFADRYLAGQVAAGREIVAGAGVATVIGEPSIEAGRIVARVALKGATVARVDQLGLASAVAGESPGEARALLLERLRLSEEPRVSIGPAWLPWPWLPSRSERIEFTVRSAPASAGGAASAASASGR